MTKLTLFEQFDGLNITISDDSQSTIVHFKNMNGESLQIPKYHQGIMNYNLNLLLDAIFVSKMKQMQ